MMSSTSRSGSRKSGGQFEKKRRPHNASRGEEFGSIAELVRNVGAEMKRVTIDGDEVLMSWAERSFRLTVDRALGGSRHDLAQLIRLMIEHPSISGSYRERKIVFIRGHLARA